MNYRWETAEAFEAWHSVVKQSLGIPFPNKNSATGKVDENATWTTSYTVLVQDDNGVKCAKVEQEIAEQFSVGLGDPYDPVFNLELNA